MRKTTFSETVSQTLNIDSSKQPDDSRQQNGGSHQQREGIELNDAVLQKLTGSGHDGRDLRRDRRENSVDQEPIEEPAELGRPPDRQNDAKKKEIVDGKLISNPSSPGPQSVDDPPPPSPPESVWDAEWDGAGVHHPDDNGPQQSRKNAHTHGKRIDQRREDRVIAPFSRQQ